MMFEFHIHLCFIIWCLNGNMLVILCMHFILLPEWFYMYIPAYVLSQAWLNKTVETKLMALYFSTRASVATVFITHPCVPVVYGLNTMVVDGLAIKSSRVSALGGTPSLRESAGMRRSFAPHFRHLDNLFANTPQPTPTPHPPLHYYHDDWCLKLSPSNLLYKWHLGRQ